MACSAHAISTRTGGWYATTRLQSFIARASSQTAVVRLSIPSPVSISLHTAPRTKGPHALNSEEYLARRRPRVGRLYGVLIRSCLCPTTRPVSPIISPTCAITNSVQQVSPPSLRPAAPPGRRTLSQVVSASSSGAMRFHAA